MSVICLQERRFASEKQKVHSELVDYFVNLEEQRRLWYLTVAIRSQALGRQFTTSQAEELVRHLTRQYGIRRANIEAALAFHSFAYLNRGGNPKVVRLQNHPLSDEQFDEQISVLHDLFLKKILEYRQALELVVLLITHYSVCGTVVGNA